MKIIYFSLGRILRDGSAAPVAPPSNSGADDRHTMRPEQAAIRRARQRRTCWRRRARNRKTSQPTSPSRISPIAGPKRRWLPSYPKSARNRPPDRDRARLRLPDRKWGSARVLEGRIVYSVRPGPNHVQRPSRFGQGHTCRTTFSGLMRPGMTSVYGFARRA